MNPTVAAPQPARSTIEASLAGLVPAQKLYRVVRANPGAPLAVGIVGPGGCGKSALLAALRQAYLDAGLAVVGAEALAADGPLPTQGAVLVDDAHQLPSALLERLPRLARGQHVRLAVAYRPWPRRPELCELEGALCAHQPLVLLGRLSRAGVVSRCTALLGAAPSAAMVDLLCEQTGGVPRLIDHVVGCLSLRSALNGDHLEVPTAAVESLRHILEALAPQLRALLLAVGLGAAIEPDILAQVLALEPGVVTDLLSHAHASGLLGEDGSIPLVCRAVVTGAAPGTRRVVQRLVLAAHFERGRPVLDLARELVEAGVRGSDLAAVFETAGDAALADPAGPQAAVRAGELYAQAVTAGADPVRLASRRAEAAALAGDLDAALRLADQALGEPACPDLGKAGNVAATVLAQRGLLARSAEIYRWLGTDRMGSAAPLAALALLATGSVTAAQELLAATNRDRPPTLLAGVESLMAAGVLESVLGSPSAALSTLTQAAALLEPSGRAALLPDTPAALAALVAVHSGELDVAVSVLQRALARGAGGVLARWRYQLLLAWVAMVRGDTGRARDWLAHAVAGRGPVEPREGLFAAALKVGLARREGDLAALHRAWPGAREAIVRHPVDLFTLLPVGELAVAAARLGDFDRVVPHLEQARNLLERLGDPPLWAAPVHWYGLHTAMLREQPDAAEPHLGALERAASAHHYAAVLAAAGRVWMRVLARQFDHTEVETAARGLQSIGLANDGSRLAGQAAIRTTDRKVMTALLGCARALQASVASPVHLPPAGCDGAPMDGAPKGPAAPRGPAAPQGKVTSRPRPGSDGGPGGTPVLSEREREVAELILTGLTYRQIGERLFISAKTVEHHVARMRQRLDVTTRDELFAQLRMCVGTGRG
jgi:DNA-binding CsgD family transcriptional regulator